MVPRRTTHIMTPQRDMGGLEGANVANHQEVGRITVWGTVLINIEESSCCDRTLSLVASLTPVVLLLASCGDTADDSADTTIAPAVHCQGGNVPA